MDRIKSLFKSLFKDKEEPALFAEIADATEIKAIEDEAKEAMVAVVQESRLATVTTTGPTTEEIDRVFDGPSYAVAERTVEEIKELSLEEIRWKPDDVLWKKYQEADSIVGTIPSQLYKIKEARQKIQRKKDQVEIYLKKDKITPYDRIQMLDIKQDMLHEEGIIMGKEQKLAGAQSLAEDSIFEDYANYLMRGQEWIEKTPEVRGLVSARDILNSQGIYIAAKRAMDQITVSAKGKRRDEALERLARLDTFFDLQDAHYESRAVHLLDFKKFAVDFSTAKEHLFDRLDMKIAGIEAVAKIPDRHHQDDVQAIEAGIGSLHGSAPLSLQTIDNKVDDLHETLKHVPLGLEDEDMQRRFKDELIRREQEPGVEIIKIHVHTVPPPDRMGIESLRDILGPEVINESESESEEPNEAFEKLAMLHKLGEYKRRGEELSAKFGITSKIEDIIQEIDRIDNLSTQDRFEAEMAKREREIDSIV